MINEISSLCIPIASDGFLKYNESKDDSINGSKDFFILPDTFREILNQQNVSKYHGASKSNRNCVMFNK
ncbi:CLUMA_CG020188, isoform A [Clunio marinus]|uniref:CLUMA_CG020188, isoform A n=1 Tax=Clunio marinus TaxID=568069 RepID=A0A1J1J465_9DIPT|nr:CLUMA_CG020188, isoform A [Clunio marinus]